MQILLFERSSRRPSSLELSQTPQD